VDLDWVIERTIRSPLERILEAVGISWENVLGAENVNDLFR
jgi:DNA polymerase elongation subunit (family B)